MTKNDDDDDDFTLVKGYHFTSVIKENHVRYTLHKHILYILYIDIEAAGMNDYPQIIFTSMFAGNHVHDAEKLGTW